MTEKTRQFNVYADPGHAWVKVKMDTLVALGIADQISRWSYQRRGANGTQYVYLEEDRDALTFWNALTEKGITPVFKETHTNSQSKIRNYASYSPPEAAIAAPSTPRKPKLS